MQISPNKVVSIHYTLKNDAGDVLDSSAGREPLAYLHGAGNIVAGLENALEGKASGDKLNVRVAPEEGYGPRHDALVQDVPRDAFQGVDDIQPGMQFHAQSPLNRVARPEEVASVIAWLATPEAEFVTGGIVDVNGASYLRS